MGVVVMLGLLSSIILARHKHEVFLHLPFVLYCGL